MKKFSALMIFLMLCGITTISAQGKYESDSFKTKSGKDITITFIKHGTLMMQVDDYVIHIDPVINFVPKVDYAKLPKADLIVVTHEHFDHYDTTAINQLTKSNTTFVTNANVAKMQGYGKVMVNGDKTTINGILLEAVPAYNVTPGNEKFHPKGRDNGFVFNIDGMRIYISGDTEEISELANLKGIDIAFLSANQPYTMTAEQCIKAAKTINPKILYPYHYNDTDIKKIAKDLKETGIDVRIKDLQ